ncbi:hypothetical protein F3Y22_tig00110637pilonHSYRG00714 [Hibiscus syriacus]|uniref:Uncharacterized protein n=1 Tax=Hibiscus syriacus TaxID=106335 RepID=A0A6A2ZYE7_HIBSY|nr:hypothetical protein F3Y22_tig00110637pilonHSYRG00714 [Hibiscus syriacus]
MSPSQDANLRGGLGPFGDKTLDPNRQPRSRQPDVERQVHFQGGRRVTLPRNICEHDRDLRRPLVPPNRRDEVQLGTTFVALQVWSPSGRPQGILNIGVTLIDSSKRSMPLYLQMGSSAIGYNHLMGEEEYPVSTASKSNDDENPSPLPKPKLRRTKSDSSSVFPCDLLPKIPGGGSSVVNGFEPVKRRDSMVNGFEPVRGEAPWGSSMVNYTVGKLNPRKGKEGSVVNRMEDPGRKSNSRKSPSGSYVGAPRKAGGEKAWTNSEVGPSPSEVAENMAKNMHHNRFDDCESSLLGWSVEDDDSIEGLRSKLERFSPPNEEDMLEDTPTVADRLHALVTFVGAIFPLLAAEAVRKHRMMECCGNNGVRWSEIVVAKVDEIVGVCRGKYLRFAMTTISCAKNGLCSYEYAAREDLLKMLLNSLKQRT